MININANVNTCEGYANCVIAASDVFDIDDNGVVTLIQTTVDESRRHEITEAVRSCPVAALWMEEP